NAPTTAAARGKLRCVTILRLPANRVCAACAVVISQLEVARPTARTPAASVAFVSDNDQPTSSSSVLPAVSQRRPIVYRCPECDAGFLGHQRCDECGAFGRRLGPGALCPHCDEAVAISDLLGDLR